MSHGARLAVKAAALLLFLVSACTPDPDAAPDRAGGPNLDGVPHPAGTAHPEEAAHPDGTGHPAGTAHPAGASGPDAAPLSGDPEPRAEQLHPSAAESGWVEELEGPPPSAGPDSGRAQLPRPGSLRFTVGVADGPSGEIFGEVSGLEVDRSGRLYVLDRQDNRIRVFGSDGRFLAEAGREGGGPGEFRYLAGSDITEEGALLIADSGNGRVTRLRLEEGGALTTEAVIPLGFPPMDVCSLGERMYVLRRSNLVGAEESGMIQEIDSTGRILRTFGDPIQTPPEDRREIGEWNHMLNLGTLACDPATRTVFFTRTLEPSVEAFDEDGSRRWGRVLEGFNRIVFGLVRGQCCWYAPSPELGSNHETWALMVGEGGVLFMGIREVGPRAAENPRYELRAVDGSSGTELSSVATEGLVRAVTRDGVYAVVDDPFPQVRVHDRR